MHQYMNDYLSEFMKNRYNLCNVYGAKLTEII